MRVPETDNNFGVNTEGIYFPPGNWGTLPVALGGLRYSTATNPASFFFSGSTLLIGTARLDSNSGNVAVTVGDYVDNTVMPAYVTNVYSCVRSSPPTGPGPSPSPAWANRTYSPGLIIITNLNANRHYCFFTPQTTAFTFFGWYAAFSTNQLPKVFLAGTLKIAGSNYLDANLPAGYLQGSDLAANEYSQMLSNSAATLSGLGLNVTWVPVPILNSNTDYFYDGIHPDAAGHRKIANALGAALGGTTYGTANVSVSSSKNPSGVGDLVTFTGTLPSDATGNLVFLVDGQPMATNALSNGQATYSTAVLATGLHTIAVNYGGDANYIPSQSSLSQRVAAGIPPVNWNPPVAISYGTALSALQLDATSSVSGAFTYAPTAGTVLNAGTNTLATVFVPTGTNYSTVTNTVSLTVLPAALTVTANNTNRNVNTPNPTFTGSIVGLQNSDNITATYGTTAVTNSPAGTYPIIPSLVDPGGRLANYTVTTNDGMLTVNLASAQTCNFFGDSVTLGFNPTTGLDITNRFSTLLCASLSMNENNFGVGGSQIADAQADMITTNSYAISNSTVSVWLAGYNDVFWFGTNAAALTDNSAAVQSLAAWLAIPTSQRVPSSENTLNGYTYGVSNSTIYFPAGWAPLPALGGLEYSSQTKPATFYFSGSTLLIGTARLTGGAGDVQVQVGDADANGIPIPPGEYVSTIYSCLRTSPDTGPGPQPNGFGNRAYSPGLIIITNLTANRHYCLFSPLSGAATFLGWYASYATNQLPKVVLSGTLKPASSDYADFHPAAYNNGSALAADEYSQMLSNAAVTLSSVGLNVEWLPVPVLNASTDYFGDGVHPNASGHQKLETAIQAGF